MATEVEERQSYINRAIRRGTSPEEAESQAQRLADDGYFGDLIGKPAPPAPAPTQSVEAPPAAPPTVEVPKPVDAPVAKAPTSKAPEPPDIRIEDFLGNLSAAYKRQIEQPDVRPEPGITAPRSIPEVVVFHSKDLGIQPNEFREAAKSRGIDIDYMIREVGRRGRDPQEVMEEAKKRGVAEFAGPKARELATQREMVRKKAVERYEARGEDVPAWLNQPQQPEFAFSEERPWFSTDAQEAPEVLKPGEKGRDGATIEDKFRALVEEDEVFVELVDLYKNRMVSGHEFIEDRVEAFINSHPNWQSLTPQEQEDQRVRYNERAAYQMAVAKGANVWTGATFIPYSAINSEELSLSRALLPTIEVIGINGEGKAVFRQQSGLSYGLEMFDVPQAIAGGILTDLSRGELTSFSESAVRGIAERKDFMTSALEATEGRSAGTRAAAGFLGFGAAVLFPDVLLGGTAIAKGVGKARSLYRTHDVGKSLEKFATEMDAGLKSYEATGDLNALRAAEGAQAEFRSKFGGRTADELDRIEAAIALNVAETYEDIADVALARRLPGELGNARVSLHPSLRKEALRVPESRTTSPYESLYGHSNHLRMIDDAQRAIDDGSFVVPKMLEELVSPKSVAIKKAGLASDEAAATVKSFLSRAFSKESLIELTQDAAAWAAKWHKGADSEIYKLDALPSVKTELEAARKAGDGPRIRRLKKINDARNVLRKTLRKAEELAKKAEKLRPQATSDLARAKEAILINAEIRAAAAALFRENVYGAARLKPPPIQLKEGIKKAMTLPKLSPEAESFAQAIRQTAANVDLEKARQIAHLMDARARVWARENAMAPSDWPRWKTEVAGMEEFAARFIQRGTEYNPEEVARASLPEGFSLRKVERRWEVIDEAEKVIGSAKDPMDAAAAAIDELVKQGKITRSDLDKSATRVGPLLLGQPLSVAESAINQLGLEYAMAFTDDGVHVVRQTSGAPNYVAFTTEETQRMMKAPNLGFTHNHPNGSALSDADIIYGTRLDARQLRATRPDGGVWVLEVPDGFGELSDAVMLEKYKTWAAIPAEVRQRSREYKDAVAAAIDECAKKALERMLALVGQGEKYVGKEFSFKWSEFYSEEFQQRVPAVLERYGIKHTFRLEPGDADLRPRPGVERTFGARAKAAAERVGPERLLLQADEVDAAAAGAKTADEIAEARALQKTAAGAEAAVKGEDPIFYSKLEKVAAALKPGKHGLDAIIPMLRKGGAKVEEIKWTNVEEFVEDARAAGKKSVTKEEIVAHLRNNRVVVDEVLAGVVPPAIKAQKTQVDEAFQELQPRITEHYRKLQIDHDILVDGTEAHRISTDPTYIERDAFALLESLREAASPILTLGKAGQAIQARASRILNAGPQGLTDDVLDELDLITADAVDLAVEMMGDVRAARKRMDELDRLGRESTGPRSERVLDRTRLIPSEHVDEYDELANTYLRYEGRLVLAQELRRAARAGDIQRVINQTTRHPAWKKWAGLLDRYEEAVESAGIRDPKYGQFTLDGGENYREVLVTVDTAASKILADPDVVAFRKAFVRKDALKAGEPRDRFHALWDKVYQKYNVSDNIGVGDWFEGLHDHQTFTSRQGSHWDTPNVLVHIRATDRVDDAGRKILYVEEIQSDWHQRGRKFGYSAKENEKLRAAAEKKRRALQSKSADLHGEQTEVLQQIEDELTATRRYPRDLLERRDALDMEIGKVHNQIANLDHFLMPSNKDAFVPDAPFKDTKAWAGLAVKRIMQMAVDEGYDGVAFSWGDTASDVIGMPIDSAREFYDTVLPSVVKKHTGAPLGRTSFDGVADIAFVDLKPRMAKRVGGPQVLFQKADAFDAADPRILRQFDDDIAKAAIEFTDEGDAIIYAFEKADVSSIVHEIGHMFRRDLDDVDMGLVTSWLKTQHGLEVGHEFGRFTAASEDVVVQAEELFARAFEEYITNGVSPTPRLAKVFEQLKDWMLEVYKAVAGTAIDVKMTDEVKGVFDRLLRDTPSQEGALPRISKFISDQILGPPDARTASVFQYIVDGARRAGHPKITVAELEKQLDETGTIKLAEPVDGKKEWSGADLERLQDDLENQQLTAAGMQQPDLAIRSAADSVRELSVSERLDNWVHKQSGVGGAIQMVAKSVLIGGDADGALRELPKMMREAINAGARKVEEAIGNAVTLLGEQDLDKMLRFLSGEIVEFRQGRQAYSSGFDAVESVVDSLQRTMNTTAMKNHHAAFDALAAYIEESGIRAGKTTMARALDAMPTKPQASGALADLKGNPKAIIEEAAAILTQKTKGEDSFIAGLVESLPIDSPLPHARRLSPPDNVYLLTESLTYFAGLTRRNGELFDGDSYKRAEMFLDEIEGIFDRKNANRVMLLLAGHGQAHAARRSWTNLGITVTKDVQEAFLRWVNGEQIPRAMRTKVRRVLSTYGLNPRFLDEGLLDTPYYLPEQARKRLSDSLARAYDVRTKPFLQTSEQEMNNVFGAVMRYVKLVMTRGGFITRPRYFLMNTFDHFNQMAMITGFRPAAASTARVMLQNLLTVPGVAQVIRAGEELSILKPQALERARRELQRHGDKISQFMSGAKYRIEVNDILEGKEGVIRVGNRVYSYRRLRETAVEEGIFASFDTTQLKKSVDETTPPQYAKADPRRAAPGLLKLVEDVAETWAERERLGAMVTLVESGLSPRGAARVTIDALYDYAGSMSKMDRAWWVSLMLPFWAFQKNANRQVLNSIFRPAVAYRMGVIRRAEELGPEAVTQVLYEFVVEPYGVDVEALPPEAQDNYYAVRKMLEDHYGGPHKVPKDARLALRMVFSERQIQSIGGRVVELSDVLKAASSEGNMKTGPYAVPFPDPTAKAAWNRDRRGFALTLPRHVESVQGFMQHVFATQKDYPWTEVLLPESTVYAGLRHLGGISAALIMSGVFIGEEAVAVFSDDPRFDMIDMSDAIRTSLKNVAEPERHPITGAVLAAWLETPESERAVRVAAPLARMLESHLGIGLAKWEGVEDPLWAEKEEAAGVPADEAGVAQTRYYASPGFLTFAIEYSPLGELNKLMKQWEKSPLERAHWSGEIVRWARTFAGVQTVEVMRPTAVRQDEPRTKTETKKPKTR